jgi:two-component system chemotaxis response regulator CheB
VFRALELGAVDFQAKPEARVSKSIEAIRDELIAKMRAIKNLEMAKVQTMIGLLARERPAPAARKDEDLVRRKGAIEVVAIGASTGGPPAVQAILTSLPADFSAGIIVSQHMPQGFTRSFAERLNKISSLIVSEAASGDRLRPGIALIAPGDHHLLVRRDREGLCVELVARTPADRYAPSVDQMMSSAAEVCGAAVLGVVLTGMGNDGSAGAVAIKQRNGACLAESEETAVIFGMPREAIRTGAIDKALPLGKLADEILARCKEPAESAHAGPKQQ